MRATKYDFLLIFGLMLTLGLSTVFAGDKDKDQSNKRPKHSGILSVETERIALPVFIDGDDRGLSGIGKGVEFYLAPGIHNVEVRGPNGAIYKKEIRITRNKKVCICLKVTEIPELRCPYDFRLDVQDKDRDKIRYEGELVTFVATNIGTAPDPIHFRWTVNPAEAINGSVEGSSITVNTTGLGDRTIEAIVDIGDDKYDKKCHQTMSIRVPVRKHEVPPPVRAVICADVDAPNRDQTKARFDNCVLQLQNDPNAHFYAFIYPGTDKVSVTQNTFDKSYKWMYDYLTNNRRIDGGKIHIIQGSTRRKTHYVVWIVPAGAPIPTP